MNKIQSIKGFADLFSPESDMFTFMETIAREVFSAYAYSELRIPIMEQTELFSRSIGGETDVVQKEMYTFPDRKDRSLTLRPEATAGIMRAYIEHNRQALEPVAKYFSFGPMFRYERPQKGRMRQFHQLDCECIGAVEPQADAEIILMLMNFLTKLGLKNIELEINSLGCKECRPEYKKALDAYFSKIPKDELCEDCRRRLETNPLRLLDCKVPHCKEYAKDAPIILDYNCEPCKQHYASVKEILELAGLPFVQNNRLVRGLDYYNRTTFEVVSKNIGSQASIAGGGRYDGLVASLGGPDVAGIGFACGMERLAMLMEKLEEQRPDFFIINLEPKGLNNSILLAEKLRSAGKKGELSFSVKSIKSQMRQADKIKAKKCLILGENELVNKTVTIKDLDTGEQTEISQENILEHI
ncbi:histidine--tRNA ligase [Desulfovibrio litoralis]|uniref:Histidine--tRNA ligase n=1 Tax=Desulfovibrio litoralis DSM 11393 TaxID=1121455 RepID=A0A1M7RVB9_9BACT|nr:histidine--tRNA ligase [Desulfovibrio litoralis]SHN50048.1 histidyl-tRNA synthetase [Desulfovibrio litoralis DSM 11393]